jgi:hypothetical protein
MREDLVAIATALAGALRFQRRIAFFFFGPRLLQRGLKIVERQRQLRVRDAFGLAAEVGAANFGDDLFQATTAAWADA